LGRKKDHALRTVFLVELNVDLLELAAKYVFEIPETGESGEKGAGYVTEWIEDCFCNAPCCKDGKDQEDDEPSS
jgi:hypothetical protein